jgi:hypothetical protein
MLTKQIVVANHDPERQRRHRAGVGPRERLSKVEQSRR